MMTCLVHYDLHVETKRQWEGAWVQGRETDCGKPVSEVSKVGFAFLSKA
jgi:hypothetical protein